MIMSVFTCPVTGEKVQHWLDTNSETTENQYDAVTCPACARLHFINRRNGKLFEQETRKTR
jgi:hypothetical protein